MNEKSHFEKKAPSPWAVELGSPVDMLESEQRFKRATLESVRNDINAFTGMKRPVVSATGRFCEISIGGADSLSRKDALNHPAKRPAVSAAGIGRDVVFTKENNFSFEIEKKEDALILAVEQEYFASLFGHMKPLLKQANDLLQHHHKTFRIRLRIDGMGLVITLESCT